MKTKLNNTGFSLLEVVLAMAILAIISIPLLSYFANSTKYNAMMADKQHATTLAQEVAEGLKAEDVLVQKTGAATYGIPYLTNAGYVLDASSADTLTSSTDGRGEAVYYGAASTTGKAYDVKVHVNTDTAQNANAIPQLYGIDDLRDVLAVDDGQFDQALTYFCAANEAYCDSGKSGEAPLTEAQIRDKMKRTINISINKDAAYYEVIAEAVYECKDIEGTGSTTTFDQNCELANVHLQDVHAIYLLIDVQKAQDELTITRGTGVAAEPELHVICQNISSVPAGYKLVVNTGGITNPVIYTNLGKNGNNGSVVNEVSVPFSPQEELVKSGMEVRNVQMQISVYKKGRGLSGDEPYITVNASKGE